MNCHLRVPGAPLLAALAVLLLFTALPAAEPEPAVRAARLITQLGDDDFDAREAAGRGLLELGEAALPGLDAGMVSPDAEVRRQARDLARIIRAAARERQVKAILAEVNAVGLDRFI